MEVLVAMTIVGIVYATLFSLMSTSLKNIGRIEEHEKLTRLGQMKLNELVLSVNQGKIPTVSAGQFDDKYSWKFHIEPVRFGGILNSPSRPCHSDDSSVGILAGCVSTTK